MAPSNSRVAGVHAACSSTSSDAVEALDKEAEVEAEEAEEEAEVAGSVAW